MVLVVLVSCFVLVPFAILFWLLWLGLLLCFPFSVSLFDLWFAGLLNPCFAVWFGEVLLLFSLFSYCNKRNG